MKKVLSFLVAISVAGIASAQTKTDYETVLKKYQHFYNSNEIDSAFGLFSERIQGMMPIDKTKLMFTKMNYDFGKLESYSFTKQDDHFTYYKTVFSKKMLTLVIVLNKEHKLENFRFVPYVGDSSTSNMRLKTATGTIYGTLLMPAASNKKMPVVLIIAGSGPTDRDGNNPMGVKANTYLLLAEALQKEGIATVRYDKRGIGESTQDNQNESTMTFEDMINDATGLIKMLKEDSRFSEVIVLGHSEGSLIGMIAANNGKANKYISVAGLGERADKVIEQQLGEQSKEKKDKAKILMDSLIDGYIVKTIDPMLSNIFRPSVMPYMSSWLKYDPQAEIKKLKINVLIVQGTTDIQVGVDEAERLKKAYPAATLKIIDGMNHVLKNAPADRPQNLATYTAPDLPIDGNLVSPIVKFINAK